MGIVLGVLSEIKHAYLVCDPPQVYFMVALNGVEISYIWLIIY